MKNVIVVSIIVLFGIVTSVKAQYQDSYKYNISKKSSKELENDVCFWVGNINANWHNKFNWLENEVPNSQSDVRIILPQCDNYPEINPGTTAECKSMFDMINLRINNGTLNIYGSLNSDGGYIEMIGESSIICFKGNSNTSWSDANGNDIYHNIVIEKNNVDRELNIASNIETQGVFKIKTGTLKINNSLTLSLLHPSLFSMLVDAGGRIELSNNRTILMNGSLVFFNNSQLVMTGGSLRLAKSLVFYNQNPMVNVLMSGGTVYMIGSGNQHIWNVPNSEVRFNNVSIDKPDGVCYVGKNKLLVDGNLSINNGALYLVEKVLETKGEINIYDGGDLLLSSSLLKINNGKSLTIHNGGVFYSTGVQGKESKVSHLGLGDYYYFNVNLGATIASKHTIFEYMKGPGINVKNGANVQPQYSFDYCTFQHGSNGIKTSLLSINNSQNISIEEANFPVFGPEDYNVSKSNKFGSVTMVSANGFFAGENYDYDPYNKVSWSNFGKNSNQSTKEHDDSLLSGNRPISSNENNITIYPNPTNGLLNIQFDESIDREVRIMNMTGKTVFHKSISGQNESIDLSAFENGVYFIHVQTDDEVYTSKIIKK